VFKKRLTTITLMKQARINKQDGQQNMELFFVQKESTDNADPNGKLSPEEDARK
jgi:hypothetical protein